MKSSPYITSVLLLLSSLVAASDAATFTCNATATAKCQSMIRYISTNASTYGNISSLFQVPVSSILGANNLSYTTSNTTRVLAGSTVKVPVPCQCTGGTGRSDHVPVYTVQAGDGLDAIARYKFDLFVNYTEIANVNNITDVSLIEINQKLWIPLPCSCDPVEEKKVMHLAYKVEARDTVAEIATEFGTSESTLLKLNGITDPKSLKEEQILDVPLKVCESSINDTSLDHDLLLPSDTYAYTAKDCVMCSCSSSSYMLDCSLASNRNSTCPAATCSGNLTLGKTNGTGCSSVTCAYTGYTEMSTSLKIHTSPVTNRSSSCNSAAARHAGQATSAWMILVVSLHMILISIRFL